MATHNKVSKDKRQTNSTLSDSFIPTCEQAEAIAGFLEGLPLVLNACTGSGEATTLEAMTRQDSRRGLYIALGRASAVLASQRYPKNVQVLTSHVLALKFARQLGYSDYKLFKVINGAGIVNQLGLRSFDIDGHILLDCEVGHAVRETVDCYCQSDSKEILREHVPDHLLFRIFSPRQLDRYRRFVREQAKTLWSLMCLAVDNGVPLGHAGYLKLWSLSEPQLPFDYVLIPQAQEISGAWSYVLRNQHTCQPVIVGDRNQLCQARSVGRNIMDLPGARQYSLTHSFGFNQPIARLSTELLNQLGSNQSLSGQVDNVEDIECQNPDVYITRWSGTLLTLLLVFQSRVADVHIIGEGQEVLRILDDVQLLQKKELATSGEFFGFRSWLDVIEFCEEVGPNPLSNVVKLVEEYGEPYLRALVAATSKDPYKAVVRISTVLNARGAIFDEVCLCDDFPEPLELLEFIRRFGEMQLPDSVMIPHPEKQLHLLRSELQILYTAVARARRRVSLPQWWQGYGGQQPDVGLKPEEEQLDFFSATVLPDAELENDLSNAQSDVYSMLDLEISHLSENSDNRSIDLGISMTLDFEETDTTTITSRGPSDTARSAALQNTEAVERIQVLEQLRHKPLQVSSKISDWVADNHSGEFQSSVERKTYILYDDEGMPTDIEYLSLLVDRPPEPIASPRPIVQDFEPSIKTWDKLTLREQRMRQERETAYTSAVQQWEKERQQQMAVYLQQVRQWSDAAKKIDQKNDERYKQCLTDQKQWCAEKRAYEAERREAQESTDRFRESYLSHSPVAVRRHVTEVLLQSDYPNYFPDDVSIRYLPPARAIEIRVRLIHPDDMPMVTSVAYRRSRDSIKCALMSAAERSALYADVVRAVCVRTAYLVLSTDSANALDHVIVNGYVNVPDPAKGKDQQHVVAAILTSKENFPDPGEKQVKASTCFENLGGRGSVNGLPRLKPVRAFEFSDLAHVDGVTV